MCSKRKIILGVAVISGIGSLSAMRRSTTAVAGEEAPSVQATVAPSINENTVKSSADIGWARDAAGREAWEVAELHLGRALQADPSDPEALKMIPEITGRLVKRAIEQGNFAAARDHVGVAKNEVDTVKMKRFDRSGPAESLDDVVNVEHQLADIRGALRESASTACRDWISTADQCAVDAHWHWYSLHSNDRNKVRDGLRELYKVQGLFDMIGDDTRGEYYRALQRLKDVVADKEWPSLIASAGFERPTTEPGPN